MVLYTRTAIETEWLIDALYAYSSNNTTAPIIGFLIRNVTSYLRLFWPKTTHNIHAKFTKLLHKL